MATCTGALNEGPLSGAIAGRHPEGRHGYTVAVRLEPCMRLT